MAKPWIGVIGGHKSFPDCLSGGGGDWPMLHPPPAPTRISSTEKNLPP